MPINSANVCAIICEYNPFHKGHAYQLAEAKKRSKADIMLCLMSGPFTQRGSPALFTPAARTKMALLGGADVVLELPCMYALREAEFFALGAISILDRLRIKKISFGCENEDLELLTRFALFLNEPPKEFTLALKNFLSVGNSFPLAQGKALKGFFSEKEIEAFKSPNNILSIAYIRAMAKLDVDFNIYPIKRLGDHHDKDWKNGLPSATALRKAILKEDFLRVEDMTSANTFKLIKKSLEDGDVFYPGALDKALLYKLMYMSRSKILSFQAVEPGLDYKLLDCAKSSSSTEELVFCVKSKRYTYARINRLLSHILLDMDFEDFLSLEVFPLRLLGFRQRARPFLKNIKSMIYAKPANLSDVSPSFELDMRAYDTWALGANMKRGLGYRASPVVIK